MRSAWLPVHLNLMWTLIQGIFWSSGGDSQIHSPLMHDASLNISDLGSTSINHFITLLEIKELTCDPDDPISAAFQSQKRTQPLKMTPGFIPHPVWFFLVRNIGVHSEGNEFCASNQVM
ncbi:unnamed protein product [Rangifer tarandus platyrhynchus]|uniref:Uncharacterized protein n=2 Tax=Rangifer tarandus platyrhynchus TaxID=3082113 RepID=A0ABN8XTL8_RANTA|nr:unnamed protein product [Rangifer tarandus platyrhynchus]